MNHVFVKIKGRGHRAHFKLMSDCTLFPEASVDLDSCVNYDPEHNLDEDAWFKVGEFSKKPFFLDFLKKDFDSKAYDELKKDDFEKISYLYAVQEGDFYFQKLTPSLFVRKKMIAFGEVAKIEEGRNRIVINKFPDAVYLKKLDVLIFRDLARVANIFRGIDELYKEATNEEVNKFLTESFIFLDGGFEAQSVSKPNRRRIALAMSSLEAMGQADREWMVSYINSYCNGALKFDEEKGRFSISRDSELKLLIYGINERFYTTHLGRKKRLANSVQDFA